MPNAAKPTKRRKIALLVQTSSDWSRQVLRGVAAYSQEHGTWDFFIQPRGFYERLRLPRLWKGDGIIVRVDHPALARSIARSKLPAVNVSWLGRHSSTIPKVVSDEGACGALAAKHFLEKGFRHFAYVGPHQSLGYADHLGRQFTSTIEQAGYLCHTFKPSPEADDSETPQRTHLARWLRKLPKPLAALVWSSESGREVINACEVAKLKVPDEVAVLCAEHDSLMSDLAPIPLSSLDMSPTEVGYRAAELLARLMEGQSSPKNPLLVPPVGVVPRRSTDTFAVEDLLVSSALRFIRDHSARPIQVIDVLQEVGGSRRMIEQRFKRTLGRTPAAEIRRVRIENAKRLLNETKLSIPEVAYRSGFNHAEVMIANFRREVGTSPGKFRRSR